MLPADAMLDEHAVHAAVAQRYRHPGLIVGDLHIRDSLDPCAQLPDLGIMHELGPALGQSRASGQNRGSDPVR